MPLNTVKVDRTNKTFGNPFRVGGMATAESAVEGFIAMWSLAGGKEVIQRELRGKNLGCWCPIGSRCHADWLLEVANEGFEVSTVPASGDSSANGATTSAQAFRSASAS